MYTRYPDENDKKNTKRIIRSTKLRKYASVYKSYIRKSEQSNTPKSPRRPRGKDKSKKKSIKKKEPSSDKSYVSKSKRKTLNPYQKFVKDESKKEKYKDIAGKDRLSVIASEWKRINRNQNYI
jgi:hypothetical protein